MSLAIKPVTYQVPGVNETKDAINKQFAGHALQIAQDILKNGSWLVPTPWYQGTLPNHVAVLFSHTNGRENTHRYFSAISEYNRNQEGLNADGEDHEKVVLVVNDIKEQAFVVSVLNMHSDIEIALIVDLFFKAVVAITAFVFVVTLLPISAIPLTASASAGKAFGVAAVAYAVRSAWNIAYPPGQKIAKDIQDLLTTDPFWKKVLSQ